MASGGVIIDLTGYRVVRESRSKEFIVFIVKIRLGDFAWTVFRRFSDFRSLSEELRRTIPDCPPCPPKRPFTSHTPQFLEERRQQLLEWIRALAREERVCRHGSFHQFLRRDANIPPAGIVGGPPTEAPAPPRGPTHSGGGGGGSAGSSSSSADVSRSSSKRVGLRDFTLLKVVGKGSFGKVMQVRKKDVGRIYAMKVLNKANIIKRNQVEHTRTERSVLGKIAHPFIVGLNYAFQTSDKLYFVLDYCAGGELFFHLGKEGKFSEDRARYYAAQITLALEHLHGIDVIYRDLKPENVLLDHHGHVRLTDFGLSKENVRATDSGAHSFCGTPEYLAPEVLNRTGHGRAVDWWSMGALLYEMLTGLPPFYCRERPELFEKIRRGKLEFPAYISPDAKHMLQGLLTRDPRKRLGSGPLDANEIKAHPFFRKIDWKAILECRIPPPWQPSVMGSMDTSQFDAEFTSMPIVSPGTERKLPSHTSRMFDGFTYEATPTILTGTSAVSTARVAAAARERAAGHRGADGPPGPSATFARPAPVAPPRVPPRAPAAMPPPADRSSGWSAEGSGTAMSVDLGPAGPLVQATAKMSLGGSPEAVSGGGGWEPHSDASGWGDSSGDGFGRAPRASDAHERSMSLSV